MACSPLPIRHTQPAQCQACQPHAWGQARPQNMHIQKTGTPSQLNVRRVNVMHESGTHPKQLQHLTGRAFLP
eukprot:1143894-Pelagomonas_calceolata.AAC.5